MSEMIFLILRYCGVFIPLVGGASYCVEAIIMRISLDITGGHLNAATSQNNNKFGYSGFAEPVILN